MGKTRQYILNSWLEFFGPTAMGCRRKADGSLDLDHWDEWCRKSRNAGATGVRILTYSPWKHPSGVVPIKQLFTPYLLNEAGTSWDLDRWNPAWFETLARMNEIAAKYGIRIWLSLFDNCQDGETEGVVPWFNNVQQVRGYYEDLHRAKLFVKKVWGILGPGADYELINEGDRRGVGQEAMNVAVHWNVAIFDQLIALGADPKTICWGAMPAWTYSKEGVNDGGSGTIEHFLSDRPNSLAQQILSITEPRHLRGGDFDCFNSGGRFDFCRWRCSSHHGSLYFAGCSANHLTERGGLG